MLYDPKWETPEVKADPMKLESLIAWLEKQSADKRYEFWCTKCLLGQYFTDYGYDVKMMGTAMVIHASGHFDLPKGFNRLAQAQPHTYGAALNRARKALAAQR